MLLRVRTMHDDDDWTRLTFLSICSGARHTLKQLTRVHCLIRTAHGSCSFAKSLRPSDCSTLGLLGPTLSPRSWLRFRSVLIVGLLFLFPRWQNWGTKLLSHQPTVTVLWLSTGVYRPRRWCPLFDLALGTLTSSAPAPVDSSPCTLSQPDRHLLAPKVSSWGWELGLFHVCVPVHFSLCPKATGRDLKNNHLIENNSIKCIKTFSV